MNSVLLLSSPVRRLLMRTFSPRVQSCCNVVMVPVTAQMTAGYGYSSAEQSSDPMSRGSHVSVTARAPLLCLFSGDEELGAMTL